MRILFGIGNPGSKYSRSRHNAGFMLLDYFAESHSLNFKASKFDYYFAEGTFSDSSYVLVKPTTFVNKSGIAAVQVLQKYDVENNNLLVICDDVNLEFSNLRIRKSGGDGGHNGLSSIIYHLNSDQFPRLRVGVSSSFNNGQLVDYVLGDFNKEERKNLTDVFKKGSILIEEFISGGITGMLDMNSRLIKTDIGLKDDTKTIN